MLNNFHWKYIDRPQWVKTWIDRTSKMPTEKKKLTRKEAIKLFSKYMPGIYNAESVIDFYIEAEMLEIVEEMSPREKFRQALSDLGHDEATVFGHWALKAYDIAHDTKF